MVNRAGQPRAGGRAKGTPNKRTVARLLAGRQEIEDAKQKGHKQAITILDELAHKAVDYAAVYERKLLNFEQENPDAELPQGLVDRFWLGMNAAGRFAAALAPYQSPRLSVMRVLDETPGGFVPGDDAKLIEGGNLKIKDPVELSRIYHRLVKA
jgi:hypothetical protein